MTGIGSGPVVTASQLSFSYGNRPVICGFTAEFSRGVTWVQGANGCGKSTLLKLLAGALEPVSGIRCINGIDAVRQPLEYRRQVFLCGPGPLPMGYLRGTEYFGFLKSLYPSFDAKVLLKHCHGFGLNDVLSQPIATLSTGTQRKLWLTAALACGTAAVLLDEPLNALDERSLAFAQEELDSCNRRAQQAWIVASHADPCNGRSATRALRMG
ncbi:MAG: ATP-binding cassette domain-containing protein [Betaproteobacteria bacterium]|jgi:ABC-type multidrug transport system ATPase subunit